MKNNEYKEITKRLSEAINYSSKTKTQIANEIGVSCPTLSQYLSGRIMPSLLTFKKLCEAIDVSADDILNIK